MLLFRPELVPLIIDGKKTQTRRTWSRPRVRVGSVHHVKTRLFGEAHCRVRITGLRRERLGDISEEDARAEGCSSREEFIRLWRSIHGSWEEDRAVWVVTFEVIDGVRSGYY